MNRKKLDSILKELKKDATLVTLPSTRSQLEHILVTYFACPKEEGEKSGEARNKWLNALLGTVDERLKSWKARVNGKSYEEAVKLQATARKALEQMKQIPSSSSEEEKRSYLILAENYFSQAINHAPTATEASTLATSEKNKMAALKFSLFSELANVRFDLGNFPQAASDLCWALKCANANISKSTPIAEIPIADINKAKSKAVSCLLALNCVDADNAKKVIDFLSFDKTGTCTYSIQQMQAYKRYCKQKGTFKDDSTIQLAATLAFNIPDTLKMVACWLSNFEGPKMPTIKESKDFPKYFRYQLSSSVEYKEAEGKGRYMVAKKAIKSGSRLLIEKPYSSVVHGAHLSSVCNFCLTELTKVKEIMEENDEPGLGHSCDFCNEAHYCSLSCSEKAYASYHRHECGFLGFLLQGTGGSLAGALIYRTLAKTGLEEALEVWRAQKANEGSGGLELLREYLNNTDLCSKGDWCDLSSAERKLLFRMSGTAVMPWKATTASWRSLQALDAALILLSRKRELLKESSTSNLGSFSLFLDIYEMAFSRICRLDFGSDRDEEMKSGPVLITHPSYLLASIVNHSCLPNMVNELVAGHLVKVATRDIKAGEELTMAYCLSIIPFRERQEWLRKDYNFTCECDLCREQKTAVSAGGDHQCVSFAIEDINEEQLQAFLKALLNLEI